MLITGTRAIAKYLAGNGYISHVKVCDLINKHGLPVIVSGRCFMTTSQVLDEWQRTKPMPHRPLQSLSPKEPE